MQHMHSQLRLEMGSDLGDLYFPCRRRLLEQLWRAEERFGIRMIVCNEVAAKTNDSQATVRMVADSEGKLQTKTRLPHVILKGMCTRVLYCNTQG